MRFASSVITALWLLVSGPATAQQQDTAPSPTLAPTPPLAGTARPKGIFLVKPYLQWGDAALHGSSCGLAVQWQAEDEASDWSVELRPGIDRPWTKTERPAGRRIAVPGIAPHWVYRATLKNLVPGDRFAYRLRKAGEIVFQAEGRAPKGAGESYRFVAFGDCGIGSPEQKMIAHRAYLEQPDFVLITGDLVYGRGRISEYRERFWPIYNADQASPSLGAPLLRSTLFLAAPGNHDIASRDLERYPDGLAYFLYWNQPLNGPPGREGDAQVPSLKAPEASRKAFVEAAGAAYPVMASFSFDYGNTHWTVLDSNPYVDWTDSGLRAWVEHDLAAAQGATWRLVTFHHPGFHSAGKHAEQQQMRLLSSLFEKGGVTLVFSGHVHNYQRTLPLRFVCERDASGKLVRQHDLVPGQWSLDTSFDGQTRTRPDGVIYVVTGAGGNDLYNPEQSDEPSSWQNFTAKFKAKIHSLSVVEVQKSTITVRQITADGQELDRFTVSK
jgi:hypothetical protein